MSIPEPVCFSHDEILHHLSKSVPEWKNDWKFFVTAFNQQEDKTCLNKTSAEILEKLAKKIKHAFDDMEIKGELEELLSKLGTDALFMLRSTGAEDSPDIVNPGGNESVSSRSDKKSISQGIGIVVASYFGKKSLEQRLKVDDDITKEPFMPVLIQPLIGEGINGNDMVYSGVMYSGEGETRIQTAPGHGELIVNSKGNFDNFYVTSNKMVYSEVQNKKFRLKPIFNEEKHRLSLVKQDNPQDIALFEKLDEQVIQEMHQVAQQIEKLYKMRMDIEFVYTPKTNTLHIVQARALPEGDRVNHSPSALDPLYLGKIIEEGGKKFEGRTITLDVNHAVIINNSKEIIVCETIEEALDVYLGSGENIKAVIVKRSAPDTSHEAGVFSSKAIPVIQIRQLDQIESVVDELQKGKKLIIDPQRKSVFQLPKETSTIAIVKEGVFKSSLTSHVTPYPHRFEQSLPENEKLEISSLKNIDEEQILLGDLLLAAKRGDPKAQKQLFYLAWEHFLKGNESKLSYKDLQSALKVLEDPYKDPNQQMDALKIVVKLASLLYEKKEISHEVFVQVVISSLELHKIRGTLSNSFEKERAHIEYLNVFEKLQGTILSKGEEDLLTSSVMVDLKETSHKKKAMESIKDRQWNEEQKESFSQAIKLESFFIGETGKQKWGDFCKKVCDNKEYAPRLASLVGALVKLDIHAQWCNVSFPRFYEENNQDTVKTLQAILKELKPILSEKKSFSEVDQSIDELKKQIPLWKDPKNFDKLQKKLHDTTNEIKKKLVFSKTDSLLKQMLISKKMQDFVEAFDLTVKSLKVSGFYENKNQQAANFKTVISEFFNLMKDWMKITGSYSREIIDFLEIRLSEKYVPTPKDLSISGKFDVSSANIHSQYDSIGWNRALIHCETLEDCFTLIHQNLLLMTNRVFSESCRDLLDNCQDLMKDVNQALLKPFEIKGEGRSLYIQGNLSGISFDHPKMTFHYNFPLRNHSAKTDVIYDYSKNKVHVSYHVFGENENLRWTVSEFKSVLNFSLLSNIKQNKSPNFERAKDAFSFEVEIKDENDLKTLRNRIADINFTSFRNSPELFVIKQMKIDLNEYETTRLIHLLDKLDKLKMKVKSPNELKWIENETMPVKFELAKREEGFDLIECLHKDPNFIYSERLSRNKDLMFQLVDKYGLEHAEAIDFFDQDLILRFFQNFKKKGEELSQKELEKLSNLFEIGMIEEEGYLIILPYLDKKAINYILEDAKKNKNDLLDDSIIELFAKELEKRG